MNGKYNGMDILFQSKHNILYCRYLFNSLTSQRTRSTLYHYMKLILWLQSSVPGMAKVLECRYENDNASWGIPDHTPSHTMNGWCLRSVILPLLWWRWVYWTWQSESLHPSSGTSTSQSSYYKTATSTVKIGFEHVTTKSTRRSERLDCSQWAFPLTLHPNITEWASNIKKIHQANNILTGWHEFHFITSCIMRCDVHSFSSWHVQYEDKYIKCK